MHEFRSTYQLGGPVFAYVGGLNQSKGVDYLVSVLEALWDIDPSAKVLVGGRGELEHLLEPAIARGQAVALGFVGDQEKALIARTATALLNPGRIGLIAVEALALNLTVFTTPWRFHGPEREYLRDGLDIVVVPGSPHEYALKVLATASQPSRSSSSQAPQLADMVERFSAGIIRMLE